MTSHRKWVGLLAGLLALGWAFAAPTLARADGFDQDNLVSDQFGLAHTFDRNLVNSWGIVFNPGGILWVADNGTGVSTLYNENGIPAPSPKMPLVVRIPSPFGIMDTGTPTGVVFNPTSDFVVSEGMNSGAALFLFATEDGTIAGWNPGVDRNNAIQVVFNPMSSAVYKGLALGANKKGNFLFATNFRAGQVDVFDSGFNPVGSFTDPTVDAGFAPFGIRNIGGFLFVTFAKQRLPDKHDDEAGNGNGFVDVFDTTGKLIRRFASHGPLNSPWGLAVAPHNFGDFPGALLVGNFGDGAINAYDLSTGQLLGPLRDRHGEQIFIDGLWGLTFDPAGDPKLYFAAGPDGESHGLVGILQPFGH